MVLFQAFKDLKLILGGKDNRKIDNFIFRLHYRFTMIILLACSILVTMRQLFGEPMECISNDDDKPWTNKLISRYCYIITTFSSKKSFNKLVGKEVPYPGVDNLPDSHIWNDSDESNIVYHSYYQWVSIVLFIQALFFYIPYLIWTMVENNFIDKLLKRVRQTTWFSTDPESKEKRSINFYDLSKYVSTEQQQINSFVYWYAFCELLNFLNILLQFKIIDVFLNGKFYQFGFDFLNDLKTLPTTNSLVRNDAMTRLFPRLSKCTLRIFGTSGSLEKHDTLCVLPINILNEKIYLLIWFWFYILGFLSLIQLIYRLTIMLIPSIRFCFMSRIFKIHRSHIEYICDDLPMSRCFFLSLIHKNLDTRDFNDLVDLLIKMKKEEFELKYDESVNMDNTYQALPIAAK